MSFLEAIKSFFVNYANFNGRASRNEYLYVQFLLILIFSPVYFMQGTLPAGIIVLSVVVPAGLALMVPTVSLAVRRLHDVNRSPIFLLFTLIPVLGSLLVLSQLLKPSQPGANAYGEPVK